MRRGSKYWTNIFGLIDTKTHQKKKIGYFDQIWSDNVWKILLILTHQRKSSINHLTLFFLLDLQELCVPKSTTGHSNRTKITKTVLINASFEGMVIPVVKLHVLEYTFKHFFDIEQRGLNRWSNNSEQKLGFLSKVKI